MSVLRGPPPAAPGAVREDFSPDHGFPVQNLNPSIVMAKTIEQIADTITNQKGHFPHTDSRPQKAQKHRYERRKVHEFIKLGEWDAGELQAQPAA